MELIKKQDVIDLIDGFIANMEEANLVSFPKSTFDFFKEELNEIKLQSVKFTSEPFDDMLFATNDSGSYLINTKDIDYIKIEDNGICITFKNNYLPLDLKQNPHIEKLIKERLEK